MKTFFLVLALLLFGTGAGATEANAQATAPTAKVAKWQHYGADHAYQTRAAAIADAPAMMRRVGWPPEAIQAMTAALRERGTTVYVVKGERYDTMRSGPKGLWRNVLVDFVSPPVTGRGVEAEVRVRAERWAVTVNGREYELTLPEVCYNWLTRVQGSELDCVVVNYESQDPRETAVAWARYDAATDPCFAHRKVSATEESQTSSTPWTAIQPGCIGRNCDFSAYNRIVGRKQIAQGTIPLFGTGYYQIRIARDQLIALCLKTNLEGGIAPSSFTAGVRWQQDYRQVGEEWHARVRYQTNDLAVNGLQINGPRGLFWWASTPEVERQLYTQVFASR